LAWKEPSGCFGEAEAGGGFHVVDAQVGADLAELDFGCLVGEVVGLEDDFDHAFVLADDFEDCV